MRTDVTLITRAHACFIVLTMLFYAPACAKKKNPRVVTPLPVRVAHVGDRESGLASWYGEPYHGRAAANGEIYDMNTLTAAHPSLPFDTIVRVTHTKLRQSIDVRIIDRGPFVEGRIIDLSREAARQLGMLEEGVARVELVVVALATPRWTVQAGAFRDEDNARRRRDELDRVHGSARLLAPGGTTSLYRVVVGAYATREQANAVARRIDGSFAIELSAADAAQ